MTLAHSLVRPFLPLGRWIQGVEHAFERARASEKAVDDTRLRIFFVLALFGFGFVTLALGATRAALFSPYGRGGELTVIAPNARADLTDRNGLVLALDQPRFGVYIDPHEMARPSFVRAALIQTLPANMMTAANVAKLDKILAGDKRQYLVGGLTPELQQQVHDLGLPGVTFEDETGRDYPLGALAAQLIGYVNKDGVGLAGAEKAFDAPIRADGGKSPTALSIDLRVQGALEDELDQASEAYQADNAAGIVVNVRTGEILAMASWPSFDPNQKAAWSNNSMTNHVTTSRYEPGSVMKVFTLAMGLDAGVAKRTDTFDVSHPLVFGTQTIHDYDSGAGTLTLDQVFTHSSNIGAAELALKSGPDVMSRYYHDFGLYAAAPGELAFESARPIAPAKLTPPIMASMAFGHAISVSPLAIATGMSAILNGGVYRPLTLRPLAPGQAPAPGRRILQAATSQAMLELMRLNVTDGTGGKAEVAGLRVGGKTGTATSLVNGHYVKGRNALNLASFAAVFPTDGPLDADRYLTLIMIDQPKPVAADGGVTTGAFTAAPVAGRVINRIGPMLGVRRVITASDQTRKPNDDSARLGAHEQ